MCTVSWVYQPGGYHLLCNRDEKRTRPTALAPRLLERGGVRYIAPVDPDFGGTWIAANEFGVSLCLLNGCTGIRPASRRRSRGILVQELAWAPSASECILWLKQLDLGPFAQFTLLVLEPGRSAMLAEWDGVDITVDPSGDSHMPLTSSSFDAAGVRHFRLNDLARHTGPEGRVDPSALYRFHGSHGSGPDAYSPCMHRDDAETVSFSWVTVTRQETRFLYSPAAPCQWSPSEQQILARAA
jgi:hypothetical protein